MAAATPARAGELISALKTVRARISQSAQSSTRSLDRPPRLVAVSKLKPMSDILALASLSPSSSTSPTPAFAPQTHFGENYLQELLHKASSVPPHLRGKIRWHFIGGLQSNKAQSLARDVEGLWAVESVDSAKKAKLLDKGRGQRQEKQRQHQQHQESEREDKEQKSDGSGSVGREERTGGNDVDSIDEGPLRVFVQVNTSGEASKSGMEPNSADLLQLCRTIRSDDECPNLRLQGLMTIGALAQSQQANPGRNNTKNDDGTDRPDQSEHSMTSNQAPNGSGPSLTGQHEEREEGGMQNKDFATLSRCRDWLTAQLDLSLSSPQSQSATAPPDSQNSKTTLEASLPAQPQSPPLAIPKTATNPIPSSPPKPNPNPNLNSASSSIPRPTSPDSSHSSYLELSMGMSEDFETAIHMGSDEVRVGSTIFGKRPAKS